MCYAKPGPRCARHIGEKIDVLRAERESLTQALMDGSVPVDEAAIGRVTRDLTALEEEFDETPTGQRALLEKISTMSPGPARDAAIAYQEAAAGRREAKMTAYREAQEAHYDPAKCAEACTARVCVWDTGASRVT